MGKVAFMFPGQASQYPGMGKELAEKYPAARAVFEEADKALGFSISKMCFEGSEEELKLTANTQPAILAVSVAAYRVVAEKGLAPDFVAGHSLGEYSALVAVGSLNFSDAVRLVHKRGKYMQEAVPAGQGGMAAIMGISPAVVQDACKRAAEGEICSAANLNSPEQTVISGHASAVKRAVEIASQLGAKRSMILAVSAPFHSALMMPAQEKLEKDLRAISFADLQVPLVTNVDADTIRKGDEAREALVRQVTMPVRWQESMRLLLDEGVNTFLEVGPGRVLTGLMRQIERSVAIAERGRRKELAGHGGKDRRGENRLGLEEVASDEWRARKRMFSLKDKVAVVTGASQGIGRETALALAEAGAKVAVGARNEEKLAALVQEIAGKGGEAFAVKLDVADAEQTKAAFKTILEKFGKVDILVNNAAINRDGLAVRMKADDWDAVLRTNLTGAHLCTQQVLPGMMRARAGRIINIASVVARMGNAGQANYVAAKAGLIGLTKAIAIEIASRNITVNAVAPGFIETPMTDVLPDKVKEELKVRIPLGRMGSARDVAAAIVFLASDEACYITGHVLDVNGGMYLA